LARSGAGPGYRAEYGRSESAYRRALSSIAGNGATSGTERGACRRIAHHTATLKKAAVADAEETAALRLSSITVPLIVSLAWRRTRYLPRR
jgi:hypothetical protein